MSEPRIPTIGLDFCEALELAEICELLAWWLTSADEAVAASLEARTGVEGFRFELRDALASWAQLLVTREFRP
jgi:hypothetical protein